MEPLLPDVAELSRPRTGAVFPRLSSPAIRQEVSAAISENHRWEKWAAWELALSQGWQPWGFNGTNYYELMAIKGPLVYTLKTLNANAAVFAAVDVVRDRPPYDLTGAGQIVGLWDGGSARVSHQEFSGRVNAADGSDSGDHATHVAGTIAAGGAEPAAKGMAPAARIESFDFDEDLAEIAFLAMSRPDEPNMAQVSNHSYGWVAGWDHNGWFPIWIGTWGDRESDMFGRYDEAAWKWDAVCHAAPYYLPIKAAGNDRTDSVPMPGEEFVYFTESGGFEFKNYELNEDPLPDGWDLGGYDTLSSDAVAKNVVTVGAIDMSQAATRDVNAVKMTSFSSWGPTDDGRVKPDLVAHGVKLYSPTAGTDRTYDTFSGTSMAAPVVAGAATLLPEFYGRFSPDRAMRSATLKALLIHTADDVGRPGPDYNSGWGLVNAHAAVEHIQTHFDFPGAYKIVEDVVDLSIPEHSYPLFWDTNSPIRVTLVWTDPPGPEIEGLDNPTPNLVNDLDLRVIDPEGVVYEPFVLDPARPTEPAEVGDNVRDNVEQVHIRAPQVAGTYEVLVTHKAALADEMQEFSLLLSGQVLLAEPDPNDPPENDDPNTPADDEPDAPADDDPGEPTDAG